MDNEQLMQDKDVDVAALQAKIDAVLNKAKQLREECLETENKFYVEDLQYRKVMTGYEENVKDYEEQMEELQHRINAYDVEKKGYEEEIGRIVQQITQLRKESADSLENIGKKPKLFGKSEYERKKKEIEDEVEKNDASIENLQKQIASKQALIESASQDQEKTRQDFKEVEELLIDLKQQKIVRESEMEKRKQELAAKTALLRETKIEYAALCEKLNLCQ